MLNCATRTDRAKVNPMVWRELPPSDLYGLKNSLIIDVRSPCEFAEERIPGALNIPLFSNEERAEIGTTYKVEGELNARLRAVSLISPKIPQIIQQIAALKEHSKTIVVHCWRGGLRSEAVASVLSIAGLACYRLSGGIKAWRQIVLAELNSDKYSFEPIVLYGMTGAGKTDLLQALSARGAQVIDLERLAEHRGSTFGGLGKGEQPTQKVFEALLWEQLRKLDLSKPVFLEAESRKIGKISLPDSILRKIREGSAVLVEGSVDCRAQRLADEYLSSFASLDRALGDSIKLLNHLKELLGKARCEQLVALLKSGEPISAVKIMLVEYYDPLYARSFKNKELALRLNSDDIQAAARQLDEWWRSRSVSQALAR